MPHGRRKKLQIAVLLLVLFVLMVWRRSARDTENSIASAQIHSQAVSPYATDTFVLLFEDFEGDSSTAWKSSSLAVGARVDSGYASGQSLYLSDTASFAVFSDSWWSNNGGGFQESGTIDFFFRPETFSISGSKGYGLLVTQKERPNAPAVAGQPELSVQSAGNVTWEISVPPGYAEAEADNSPFLVPNPYEELKLGQWYHIAATWGDGSMALYVNDQLVDSVLSGSAAVRVDTFLVGATALLPATSGWAARGRIDRFRLSSKIRIAGEFPKALEVEITSPSGGGVTLLKPFPVTHSATSSDTRPISVDLFADTDAVGLNGTLIAAGLGATGTNSVGNNLADGTYYFYAVATAGTDTAYFYTTNAFQVGIPGVITASQRDGQVGQCLIVRSGLSWESGISAMRAFREWLLDFRVGRICASLYHWI